MAKKVIICMGVPRSGSTWAFNMALSVLRETRPDARIVSCFADEMSALPPSAEEDFLVVKTHGPQGDMLAWIECISAPVIVSVRDPRDCMASMIEFYRTPEDKHRATEIHLQKSCSSALRLARLPSACVLRYEDGATADPQTSQRIASCMGCELTDDRAQALTALLSAETTKNRIAGLRTEVEPDTLWRPRHVGDGLVGKYRTTLTAERVRSIECWSQVYREAFDYDVTKPTRLGRGRNTLMFGDDSDALLYLSRGFSVPEPGLTWTDGPEAVIRLPLAELAAGPITCELRSRKADFVQLLVMLLDDDGESIAVSHHGDIIRFEVPAERAISIHELDIHIAILQPFCPQRTGASADDRQLGIALQSVMVHY